MSVLALAVCGCVRESVDVPAPSEERMVTVRLSTESSPEAFATIGSKTVLMDDLGIEWHNGDAIAILSGSDAYKLTNVNPDGPEALFEGEIPEACLNRDFKAVIYPYEVGDFNPRAWGEPRETASGNGIDFIVIPEVQPLVAGSFARGYNFSAATFKFSEEKPLYFRNLTALLGVSLTGNATVTSITVTAPDNINGTFHFETNGLHTGSLMWFKEMVLKLDESSLYPGPSNTVTLISEEGVELTKTSQNFYACVFPYKTTGDYSITVETKQGKTFTRTFTVDRGFDTSGLTDVIGQVLGLGEADLLCSFADLNGQSLDLDPTGREALEVVLASMDTPEVLGMPDWLTYYIDGTRMFMTPEMNLTDASRSAEVTIRQGDVSGTIEFRQEAASVVSPEKFGCDSEAAVSGTFIMKDFFVEAVPDWGLQGNEWLTPERNGDSFIIKVAENISGKDRTGTVGIIDGHGKVVSSVTVKQTGFNHEGLTGRYSFYFKDKNSRDSGWKMSFVKDPETDGSYLINAVMMDGKDMSAYCPDIRFDYVSKSSEGPMLKLTGPQHFAPEGFVLKPVRTDGSATDGYGIGFDLVYTGEDGKISFDFRPNAAANKSDEVVSGLGIYDSDGELWERIMPLNGAECLSISKWGRNHEGYTEK